MFFFIQRNQFIWTVQKEEKKRMKMSFFYFCMIVKGNALYDWTEFKRFWKKKSSLSKNKALLEIDKLGENWSVARSHGLQFVR